MLTWMLFYLWKYLVEYLVDASCLRFKCLKSSLYKKNKNKVKDCPDNLNTYTTR